jgi:hypothetical protein
LIAPLVGGWEQAAQLPFGDALAIAEQHLKKDSRDALRHAQSCWYSMLPLFAMGGTPPPAPGPDEEDEDEEDDD